MDERIPFSLFSVAETFPIISTDAGLHADDPRLAVCRYLNGRRNYRTVVDVARWSLPDEWFEEAMRKHRRAMIARAMGRG